MLHSSARAVASRLLLPAAGPPAARTPVWERRVGRKRRPPQPEQQARPAKPATRAGLQVAAAAPPVAAQTAVLQEAPLGAPVPPAATTPCLLSHPQRRRRPLPLAPACCMPGAGCRRKPQQRRQLCPICRWACSGLRRCWQLAEAWEPSRLGRWVWLPKAAALPAALHPPAQRPLQRVTWHRQSPSTHRAAAALPQAMARGRRASKASAGLLKHWQRPLPASWPAKACPLLPLAPARPEAAPALDHPLPPAAAAAVRLPPWQPPMKAAPKRGLCRRPTSRQADRQQRPATAAHPRGAFLTAQQSGLRTAISSGCPRMNRQAATEAHLMIATLTPPLRRPPATPRPPPPPPLAGPAPPARFPLRLLLQQPLLLFPAAQSPAGPTQHPLLLQAHPLPPSRAQTAASRLRWASLHSAAAVLRSCRLQEGSSWKASHWLPEPRW
jgi:hypothetical protein